MGPLEMIHARLDRMEDKIDKMLAFKWQIVGGTFVVSIILGVLIQTTIAIIGGK